MDLHDDNLKMADSLGVNIVMMDTKLAEMISEAQTIEKQMAMLINQMNNLKNSIAEHKASLDGDSDIMQTPIPKVETSAEGKPADLLTVNQLPNSKPSVQSTPKVEITPKAEPVIEPEVKVSMPPQKTGVMDVRVGVHSDKTRLVFDIIGSTQHQLFHDKDVGIFTITLPETPWNTLSSRTYAFNQLAGYEAKSTGNGTIVAMAIKNTSDVKILALEKTETKPARLVVDLIK
jgi:hypothetical protein